MQLVQRYGRPQKFSHFSVTYSPFQAVKSLETLNLRGMIGLIFSSRRLRLRLLQKALGPFPKRQLPRSLQSMILSSLCDIPRRHHDLITAHGGDELPKRCTGTIISLNRICVTSTSHLPRRHFPELSKHSLVSWALSVFPLIDY